MKLTRGGGWRSAAALGLLAVLIYIATAIGLIKDVTPLTLALVFAIGPVAIFGVLSISDHLAQDGPAPTLRPATVFLVIAFALFTLMLVVQQTVFIRFREFSRQATDPAALEGLRTAFRLVNQVQLGIDVCFDIFYCAGVALLSIAMYRHRDFGRSIGAFGVLSAAGLLFLNLATFPHPPAERGLVDLGPVTGVWWVVVILQFIRIQRRARSSTHNAA
jgi:hypothetical protein